MLQIVSLRLFGLIFKYLCFLLAIGKCSDHLLSGKKSHQISALRPPQPSFKTWIVTSAAEREGQVTAGETYIAKPCSCSKFI